jgi:hypothetical protein
MVNRNAILDSFIEIDPVDSDTFLKVKETLTRIGIACRKPGEDRPTLWQSCHILHKKGRYYIVHFKQLFLLDGRFGKTKLSEEDLARTALIADMLVEWGLVKTVKDIPEYDYSKLKTRVTVIPHKEKGNWNLRSKYNIGKKVI